jgi:catechol 2,3-dioxygenase-like lactoylglutathione lyase family enzyme
MSGAKRPGVPTLRSVDHVAFTVPNLDDAVRFFVDHFGAELAYLDGPFVDDESDGMRDRLAVDPRARCTIAMLRLGRHHNVELFEYEAPDQRTALPRNSDAGGHHLAFYVDDIDAGYDYVASIPGVVMQQGPNGVDSTAPVAGQRWFYFQTPWGMQMELTTCATGGFYEGLPGALMAAPSESWR